MAVYTKISTAEIEQYLQKYNLGNFISLTEIVAGIDNSNFILQTQKGKFILTVFESRISQKDLPFFINLKLHLAQKSICCPLPIQDNQGLVISEIKNKKSTIVTFLNGKTLPNRLDGYYDNITSKHCFEVGKILAKLHLAASDFKERRANDLGIKGFRPLFYRFENLLENYQKDLASEIIDNLNFLEKSWNYNLPEAPAHLDLFPDNVFFDEEQNLSGVIDFYFAANDALIYDFAIAVNAWCFDEKNNFDQNKFDQIFNGYQTLRNFSDSEKTFLKIALVAAAMRFLLTRLNDMFFTPENSYVNIKNPQEYLAKLRFFKSKI
ncbi:MAG: homoserine kinase [Rickettsiales bacterium]|nr:homoserine kinase [Rickettsiales bacterium]